MTTRIVFNGQEYPSLDAMPPDVRQAYDQLVKQLSDPDHAGVPDILQHGLISKLVAKEVRTTISVNGQTYQSPDQMPPDVRQLYDKAMAGTGAGQSATPGTVRTEIFAKAGNRTLTLKISGRQLVTLLLILLLGIGLIALGSGWHR